MNILLVEDEAGIREGLASFLRLKGHRVTTADTCERGLTHLRDSEFDLLITDWRIGDGLGDALVVASGCPSIVVSGFPEEVQDLGEQVTVLRKPVMPQDLLGTIEAFVAARRPAAAPGRTAIQRELPADTADRIELALALAGAPRETRISDDGAFVVVEAPLPRGDGSLPDLERIGGDLRVLSGPDGPRFELRLCRDARPLGVEQVLGLGETWPPAGERFAVDLHGCGRERLQEFVAAVAAARRRPRGEVHFVNVPSAFRLWLEISGKVDDMPKRTQAAPRLPEVLAMLWS